MDFHENEANWTQTNLLISCNYFAIWYWVIPFCYARTCRKRKLLYLMSDDHLPFLKARQFRKAPLVSIGHERLNIRKIIIITQEFKRKQQKHLQKLLNKNKNYYSYVAIWNSDSKTYTRLYRKELLLKTKEHNCLKSIFIFSGPLCTYISG